MEVNHFRCRYTDRKNIANSIVLALVNEDTEALEQAYREDGDVDAPIQLN